MYFKYTGRNQRRGGGFNVKKCFQVMLVLAVCIWFLYQIKRSSDTKDDSSLQGKLGKRNDVVILGRKGDVELSDRTMSMYMSDSKDVILDEAGVKPKERGGGGDDELDGSVDERGEVESFDKRVDEINVKIEAEEEKILEPERQYNLSTSSENIEIEMRDMDNEIFSDDKSQERVDNSKRFISNVEEGGDEDRKRQISYDERRHKSGANNLVEQGDNKDLETHTEELQRGVERSSDGLNRGKLEETDSSKDNGEDKDLRSKEITRQVSGTENATILGQNEVAKGLHGFHDENGVPEGGNDVVEFTLEKSTNVQASNQETLSSSDHQSKATGSSIIKEDASGSERNTTYAEKTQ